MLRQVGAGAVVTAGVVVGVVVTGVVVPQVTHTICAGTGNRGRVSPGTQVPFGSPNNPSKRSSPSNDLVTGSGIHPVLQSRLQTYAANDEVPLHPYFK